LGDRKLYNVMMWIGPYGCRSPLHFDPLDNFLMQFVGTKEFLLFPPDVDVYAGSHGSQKNTSPFDFERDNLDFTAYPRLAQLPPAVVGTLKESDILYIPKKWWHQIRTTETSISVNAWWR
jgi:ribosomal protein L16 Arg81 hydroxylase